MMRKAKEVQEGAKARQKLPPAKVNSADLSFVMPEEKWDTLPKVEQEAIALKGRGAALMKKF